MQLKINLNLACNPFIGAAAHLKWHDPITLQQGQSATIEDTNNEYYRLYEVVLKDVPGAGLNLGFTWNVWDQAQNDATFIFDQYFPYKGGYRPTLNGK